MACNILRDENKNRIGFVCSINKKQVCHICGKPMTSLCDATRKDGTPCDNPMCDEHRHTVGYDTDVCKYHNYPKYISQAILNRKERAEIEEYFEKQYAKSSFRVVPGHWPEMKTKKEVDEWISNMERMVTAYNDFEDE